MKIERVSDRCIRIGGVVVGLKRILHIAHPGGFADGCGFKARDFVLPEETLQIVLQDEDGWTWDVEKSMGWMFVSKVDGSGNRIGAFWTLDAMPEVQCIYCKNYTPHFDCKTMRVYDFGKCGRLECGMEVDENHSCKFGEKMSPENE